MCPSRQPLKSHPRGQYFRPWRLLPSEVRPEGPFISRFRNILIHINFQSQLKTERRTQGKRQRAVPPSNPTLYPPLHCRSAPAGPGESSFYNREQATRVIHAPQLQATSGIPQTCVSTTKSPFPVSFPGHPFWKLCKHPPKLCQTAFP